MKIHGLDEQMEIVVGVIRFCMKNRLSMMKNFGYQLFEQKLLNLKTRKKLTYIEAVFKNKVSQTV